MDWLYLALLAPLAWAVASIFDKILVGNYLKDGVLAGITTNLASGMVPLMLCVLFPITLPSGELLFGLLAAGVLWGIARITYCIGISREEASRVVPLMQLNPALILAISVFFLNETLRLGDIVGFGLVFIGALWISLRQVGKTLSLSRAMIPAIIHNIAITLAILILKHYSAVDWWTALVIINIGFILTSLPLLVFNSNASKLAAKARESPLRIATCVAGIAVLVVLGRSAFFSALQLAPAAIVSVIAATQTLLVLIFAIMLTTFFPRILSEDIRPSILVTKSAAILTLLGGLAILAFT